MWPSAALNVKLNTVEPIRMNITKHDSRVVFTSACFSSDIDRRRWATAISSAPTAPIAPPSVGVATPRKIVPRTRKISTSGGISTKVTRSDSFDTRFSRNSRLSSARARAVSEAIVIDRISTSSPGAGNWRSTSGLITRSCTCAHANPAAAAIASRTSSDLWPLDPFASPIDARLRREAPAPTTA